MRGLFNVINIVIYFCSYPGRVSLPNTQYQVLKLCKNLHAILLIVLKDNCKHTCMQHTHNHTLGRWRPLSFVMLEKRIEKQRGVAAAAAAACQWVHIPVSQLSFETSHSMQQWTFFMWHTQRERERERERSNATIIWLSYVLLSLRHS